MPSLSKYTQWKVIGGYSLLFLLSILAAVLIYKQITKLIVNEENRISNRFVQKHFPALPIHKAP